MMSLITELAAARKRLKLTQSEVAKAAGLSRMTVQRIEAGEIDPRLATVLEMSRVLKMDVVLVPAELRQEFDEFLKAQNRSSGHSTEVGAPSHLGTVAVPKRETDGSA